MSFQNYRGKIRGAITLAQIGGRLFEMAGLPLAELIFMDLHSLLNPSLWRRLTDRTFLTTVGTALTALGGVVSTWQTAGVPVGEKVQVTYAAAAAVTAVVTFYNHGQQKLKRETMVAALAPVAPADIVAAGQ